LDPEEEPLDLYRGVDKGQVSTYIRMTTTFVSVWLPHGDQSRSQEWRHGCVLSSDVVSYAKMCLADNIEYKEDSTSVLEARRKEARRI
jgi:hypothetical protein